MNDSTSRSSSLEWWASLAIAAAVVVVVTAVCVTRVRSAARDEAIRQTKEAGDRVFAALESYRARMGGYPDALSDLVPVDLPRLDPPAWGAGGWHYGGAPDGGRSMYFHDVGGHPRWTFYRTTGQTGWTLDDESF